MKSTTECIAILKDYFDNHASRLGGFAYRILDV